MPEINENQIKQHLKAIASFKATPQVTARDLARVRQTLTTQPHKRKTKPQNIWKIITMITRTKITKFAAAAVIIIAVMIGINHFGGSIGGSSVAFGEVLEYFQTLSYTFDLTVDTTAEKQGSETFTMQAMVRELGRIRLDYPKGKLSSITDVNTGRTLILFHQYKAAVSKKEPFLNKNTGGAGIFSFCTKPIENLWNVCDGTEEQLGQKELGGQKVTGFRILQEDQYFQYDITIWASSQSGVPSMVRVIAKPLDESYPSMRWTMENFNLDVEPDEKLFSLDPPEGYILAYQEDLEKLEVNTKPSDESKKIVQMLELWTEGRKDQAIESLLKVDWTKQIEFGKEPYIFSLTENGYISLKAEDQKQVIAEVMATTSTIRNIVRQALDMGQTAIAAQNYEGAELYFNAALQLGKLLDRNPESMIIVRMVGIAVEKKTLNEMISLYTTINNQEKLHAAEKQLHAAEAQGDKIKKQAGG